MVQLQARGRGDATSSGILVNAEKNTFGIIGNALHVLQKTAQIAIPGPDKGADTLGVRSGQVPPGTDDLLIVRAGVLGILCHY